MQRIFLAEDDAPLAAGLIHALGAAGYSIDWHENGNSAARALAKETYDLAILDLGLPGKDGFALLTTLRKRGNIPALILTASDSLNDRVHGLDRGADDYLTKPFDLPELEARIRALIRRSQGVGSNIISHGSLQFDVINRSLVSGGVEIELLSSELKLMELLIFNAGKVVNKKKIMAAFKAAEFDPTPNAIEVYVHKLRKKLEPYGVVIRTIRGLGYLLEIPSKKT